MHRWLVPGCAYAPVVDEADADPWSLGTLALPDLEEPDDAVRTGESVSSAAIPLRQRDGTVVAYTEVDIADMDFVNQWTWRLTSAGYARRTEGRTKIYLHRVLLGLSPGDGLEGDHWNHDPLDNRRSNPRVATHQENLQNMRAHRDSSSRYRGVSRTSGGRWVAQAYRDGRQNYLGTYDSEIEAAEVAAAYRAAHMPGSREAA